MLGRNGYSSIKLSDFKANFKDRHWLCFKKGEKAEKIRIDIYLTDKDYYKIGVFCIKNGLSRGEVFIRATFEKMDRMKSENKLQKLQMKNGSLV